MTFPTVAAVGEYAQGTPATSHSANYPATVSAGQLLLYFGCVDGTGDTATISGPTIIMDPSSNQQNHGTWLYYATAAGTEGGGTYTVTASSSEQMTAHCLAIDGWDGTTAPEISASIANGTDANPNPPSITPSWGAEDTLFIAVCTYNGTGVGASVYPYTDNQSDLDASGAAGSCVCTDGINGSPEDPGTFTINAGNSGWQAFTIAVRPSAGGTTIPIFARHYRTMKR